MDTGLFGKALPIFRNHQRVSAGQGGDFHSGSSGPARPSRARGADAWEAGLFGQRGAGLLPPPAGRLEAAWTRTGALGRGWGGLARVSLRCGNTTLTRGAHWLLMGCGEGLSAAAAAGQRAYFLRAVGPCCGPLPAPGGRAFVPRVSRRGPGEEGVEPPHNSGAKRSRLLLAGGFSPANSHRRPDRRARNDPPLRPLKAPSGGLGAGQGTGH